MKSAMKKLLSLMLVAMLLVSAIPFAASADGTTPIEIYYKVTYSDGTAASQSYVQTLNYDASAGKTAAAAAQEVLSANANTIASTLGVDTSRYTVNGDVNVHDWTDNSGKLYVFYEITATPQDSPVETTKNVDAPIYVDGVNSGKTVPVYCKVVTHTAPAWTEVRSVVTTASQSDVLGALGTAYSGKTVSSMETVIDASVNKPIVKVTLKAADTNSGNSGSGSNSSNGGSTTTYNVKFFDVNGNCHWNIDVVAGSTVDVADNTTATQVSYAEEHVGTKSGYTFKGWQINGTGDVYTTSQAAGKAITAATSFYPYFVKNSTTDSTAKTDKVSGKSYKVYLRIYTNNNLASATKIVDITDGYASDSIVGWSEVEGYVKSNFNASNSLGITIDGIYVYEGSWASNWLSSDYQQTNVTIPDTDHRTSDINLMVMLTGKSGGTVSLKSSSSSTADSSNPKTGDTIGMTFVTLGVSASALAAAYFVEKKRIAR